MRKHWILCLSLGFFAISAHAQAPRRRAVAPPARPPSSAVLIDAAVAKGTITAEQALTYKVFADFGDARLPAQFQGDDSDITEGVAADLAAEQWSTLSQATKDVIGPYLVPPFYEGSWWELQRVGTTAVRPLVCRPWENFNSCPVSSAWVYRAGAHVRIWMEASKAPLLEADAEDLINETDTKIWPLLNTVMGRTPILMNEYDGKKLLDVVIVDEGRGTSVTATTYSLTWLGCGRSDGTFIIINRLHPQYLNQDYRRSFYAHELMHAVQHTYNTKECLEPPPLVGGAGYKWLMESTATWFEDVAYPTTNREHKLAKYYVAFTNYSIDDRNAPEHVGRNYGAYLLFFYLTRIAGGDPTKVVRFVWEATESNDAIHALQSGLSAAAVPLDTYWDQFAVYTWNEAAPFDRYLKDDQLEDKADINDQTTMSLSGRDAKVQFPDVRLPHLSIRYYQFDFPDNTVSTVAFYNGLARSLNLVTSSLDATFGKILSATAPSDPASVKGAHVDALFRIGGKWTHEDWTSKPFRTFCRDAKAERLESMVVILSNSDITNELVPAGNYPPVVQVTNVGCYAWDGIADLQMVQGGGEHETISVTGLHLKAQGDIPEDESTPMMRMFSVTDGTYSWTASGSSGSCKYSGSVSGESMAASNNTMYTFPYAVQPAPAARGVMASLPQQWASGRRILNVVCGSTSDDESWNAAAFFLSTLPTWDAAQLKPDGRHLVIDISKLLGQDQGMTGTWVFTATSEP